MKFFADYVCQEKKTGYIVCGDYYLCDRNETGTVYLLCDGIGSGVYANIAAIACAERLMELIRRGVSLRASAEMVAASMNRARNENIPFSAFSAALISHSGQFTVYTYEAPAPLLLRTAGARVLTTRVYTAGYEVISESVGWMHRGNGLVLSSDGVTQAGMGHGYGFGIGSEGVADFINRNRKPDDDVTQLPRRVVDYCHRLSTNRYEDDTTFVLLHCREASELTLLTGPPSSSAMDYAYARIIKNAAGKKIVCGSTTLDIISRELKTPITTSNIRLSQGSPPEYFLENVDLATEGAITLNQVCNILDESREDYEDNTPVQRLCVMLNEADVIRLHIGNAANDAHDSILFKQVGVRVRRATIGTLAQKLRDKGKLVIEKYY
ncbi:MAG: serine/threonine-protein phosphatase [Clostridiales bacterium]|jgi:hypothetical protein|nr:serine/threonine-protein phosphatase [Clostridiales bacterium]